MEKHGEEESQDNDFGSGPNFCHQSSGSLDS